MIQRESGFTILETSLVLAVTGLVISIILMSIGTSLNYQRYNDAVAQSVDFFRGQYTSASSTINNRLETDGCNASGTTTAPDSIPGASDCLLLGKVLRSSDGKKVTVHQVLALHDPSTDLNVGSMLDDDILTQAQLYQGNQLDPFFTDWGTRFIVPGSAADAKFTIMIVRTPVSGTIRTYTSSSDTVSVVDLLNSSISPQDDRRFCIDTAGLFSVGVKPMGLDISKGASNTTGVRIVAAGECV